MCLEIMKKEIIEAGRQLEDVKRTKINKLVRVFIYTPAIEKHFFTSAQ
jgi:hypothetical protein